MENPSYYSQAKLVQSALFLLVFGVALCLCLNSQNARAQSAQVCTTMPATASVTVNQWDDSSGWKLLTLDAAQRAAVTGLSWSVLAGDAPGNKIHVLENWRATPIASETLQKPGPLAIPAGAVGSTLQFYIEHVPGTVLQATLRLCTAGTTPTPTPTPDPTPVPIGNTVIPLPALQFQPAGDYTLPTAKKSAPPLQANRSEGFGEWPSAHLVAACVESHDRYWVAGPDGRAYHTWHPVTETITLADGRSQLCEYGHEHGSDPSASPAFRFSGGWPPFGYLMQQQAVEDTDPSHRHEDHVGHKINVATFRAALGQPQNAGSVIYDAGFSCHFITKIHQGAWSVDAFANHVHEYFATVACNDKDPLAADRGLTWLSIKRMGVFGHPNTFKKNCPSAGYTDQALDGLLDFNGSVINNTKTVLPLDPSGNREFQCFESELKKSLPREHAQPELWTGLNSIQTGTGGSMNIAPYYIVKNPARLYDDSFPRRVRHTIDYCYDTGGALLPHRFCSQAPAQKPAWDSPASPFKGTLRAVNFKQIQLYNAANSEICTNVFGEFSHEATAAKPCDASKKEIYQAVSKTFNQWDYRCHRGRCGPVTGSLENAIPAPLPGDPTRYLAPGIGFEHLESHDHPSVRGQN